VNVTAAFAKQNAGAQLRLSDDTETRVAIKLDKRTIAYVAVARDLWGQLMVDRFNCHEELLGAAKALFAQCDPEIGGSPDSPLERMRRAIAKAEGRS
jgi:hypothetical protein